MIKSKKIDTIAHREYCTDARDALRNVAFGYAEKVRKEIMKEFGKRSLKPIEIKDLINEIIWCDESPGGIPSDLDTPIVRRQMEKILVKSFGK